MKKLYFFVLALFLNSIIFSASISVTTPDGLDYWNIGETKEIEWRSIGDMDNYVKIRLFDKTGNTRLLAIADKTPNDGKFDWTIPESLRAGEYIIRVKTLDNLVSDDSAVFHIQDRRLININLISPSGGARYLTPGIMLIKWEMESAHLVEHVKLTLKKWGQVKHHVILDNDGSESLPLTDNINDGTDYSIRIEDADDPTIFDESGYFEVYHSASPSINILKPNKSKYGVGETMNIKWECSGFDGVVNVHLLRDNSQYRKNLASSIRDNFHNWNIDFIKLGKYQIRVSSVNDNSLSALSNKFDILSYTDILVFSKRGIFEKKNFMKGERTKLRFAVNNPFSKNIPVYLEIRFCKGKIRRPPPMSIKRLSALARTKYTGDKTFTVLARTNSPFDLPVTINDQPGDYTVVITVLPSSSSNSIDRKPGNNTIYGYFKVILKVLQFKKIK